MSLVGFFCLFFNDRVYLITVLFSPVFASVCALPDRMPPIPDPGETDQLLPLSGHHHNGLQSTGLPRQAMVS